MSLYLVTTHDNDTWDADPSDLADMSDGDWGTCTAYQIIEAETPEAALAIANRLRVKATFDRGVSVTLEKKP